MILMDVQMPVMNGYEAAKAIRRSAHELAGTIPIIAMTANAFSEDIQHSLAAGMNAHISKPIEMRVSEKDDKKRKIWWGGAKRKPLNRERKTDKKRKVLLILNRIFLSERAFLISGKFIFVMNMHVRPVHKQYIKYAAVCLAFHNSSMIKYRKIRPRFSFSEMKVNIVIFISAVNLFPDAGFYVLLFIFPDQVTEAFLCACKKFIHIFISGHMKELMVCVKELILFLVRPVYDKCSRKVFGDIFQRESQLFADA